MKTSFKIVIRATLALSALSLCSCAQMLNDLYELPSAYGHPGLVQNSGYGHTSHQQPSHGYSSHRQASHGYAHSSQPTFQQVQNGYTAVRSALDPAWGAHEAIGNGLAGLLPWYGVGSSPSYQRQAGNAYRHMGGHAEVGGYTLQQLNQE